MPGVRVRRHRGSSGAIIDRDVLIHAALISYNEERRRGLP
jgi:hypothetical protein